jgi:transketolase
MNAVQTDELTQFADRIRLRAVRMVAPHGFGYLGQALSSAELMAALYSGHYEPARDDLVVSPGHYIISAFAAGPEVGAIDEADLATYGHDGSILEAIGTEKSPAVDLTCGSLGQGLSGAVGFALSHKMRGEHDARVFALVSDGELEEGQTWEAAMFAAHNRLGSLTVILDANDSQVDGPVSSITTIEPIAAKWESFGWAAFDVDGHDAEAVHAAIASAIAEDRPAIVIGRTSTVHGLSALPEGADGHFIKLSAELANAAIAELEARLA